MQQLSFWDKSLIKFKEDDTELNNNFVKGSVWEYEFEQEDNFIILLDGVYYGPLKRLCEKV